MLLANNDRDVVGQGKTLRLEETRRTLDRVQHVVARERERSIAFSLRLRGH